VIITVAVQLVLQVIIVVSTILKNYQSQSFQRQT